jgi:hypothetical protein
MTNLEEELLAEAWVAVSGDDPGAGAGRPAGVTVIGPSGHLASRFAVGEVAVASVGAALLAAAAVSEQRGRPVRTVHLDRAHVADAVRSERYFRVAGRPAGASFAPLSRFWRAADGWVRTHANYPWHRAALARALDTDRGRRRARGRRRRAVGRDGRSARLRGGRDRDRNAHARRVARASARTAPLPPNRWWPMRESERVLRAVVRGRTCR